MTAKPLKLHKPPAKKDDTAKKNKRSRAKAKQAPLPADLAHLRLIDAVEFRTILGLGASAFEHRLAAGKLPPPIRLSATCHRWRLRDVVAWIEAACPDPQAKR